MNLLVLSKAKRTFINGDSPIDALNGVNLTIQAGEWISIMGQSGSGKSTLMTILGCLDHLTDGSYTVQSRSVASLNVNALAKLRRETFGFIFQRYHLLPHETALENVEMPGIYAGLPIHIRKKRARNLLERLGLADRLHHRPAQLSGGQQQRVAIARALMNDPPVILADEPTGALDSHSSAQVMSLLGELHDDGKTLILITHDEKIAQHAKRQIHLQDGCILHDTKYL